MPITLLPESLFVAGEAKLNITTDMRYADKEPSGMLTNQTEFHSFQQTM